MTKTSHAAIHAAIADLASDDVATRQGAHRALEAAGHEAVPPLLEALPATRGKARQEAFKALRALADPRAADAFLGGLEDEDADCRWIAAEGLVALGRDGLARVLRELTRYPETEWKLRGTHHVLSGFRSERYLALVAPVLRAFTSEVASIDLPRAALEALESLRRTR